MGLEFFVLRNLRFHTIQTNSDLPKVLIFAQNVLCSREAEAWRGRSWNELHSAIVGRFG